MTGRLTRASQLGLMAWVDVVRPALYPHWQDQQRQFMDQLLTLRGLGGGRVLEVGCGDGHLGTSLQAAGWKYTGIDLSPAMIDRARVNGAEMEADFFNQGIGEFNPSEPFDLLVCLGHSMGYGAPQSLTRDLAACRRLLRPGGTLILDFRNRGSVLSAITGSDGIYTGYKDSEMEVREAVLQNRWLVTFHSRSDVFPDETYQLALPTRRSMDLRWLDHASWYGDYQLSRYTGRSPRMIVVGRRLR